MRIEDFQHSEFKSTVDLEDMYKRLSSYIKESINVSKPLEYVLLHKLIEDNLQMKKDIEELKKRIEL